MADDLGDTQQGGEEKDMSAAVFFEMENLFLGAREHCYNAMAAALKKKSITLTPQLFSKCCLTRSLAGSVAWVVEETGGDAESAADLATAVQEAYEKSLQSKSVSVDEGFVKLLKSLSGANLRLGALSHLSSELAEGLLAKVGVDGLEILMHAETGVGSRLFTKESWSALAREIGLPRPHCTALGTSAAACRSALSANMRCIIVPDQYTAYQDFGGADRVVDALDKKTILAVTFDPNG